MLGTGILYLTNTVGPASTFTGFTTVAGGTLNIQSANALGFSADVVVANGAGLQLQGSLTLGSFTMSRPLFLNGSGASGNGALENVYGTNFVGATALNGSATIGVDAGALSQSGVMSGPGTFTKAGGGLFILNQVNTFLGGSVIVNGIVEVTAQTFAMGSAVGVTTVQSGATLFINNAGGQFGAYTLNLSGTGYAGTLAANPVGNLGGNLAGALLFNQATTFDGNIILNPGTTIGVTAGNVALQGIIGGAADLVKMGAGTLTLNANSTYTGNTIVNGGVLQLQTDTTNVTQGGGTILNPPASSSIQAPPSPSTTPGRPRWEPASI